MDHSIPTEASLAKMLEMGAAYLVGTPKGWLNKLEKDFLGRPWQTVRQGILVKHLNLEEDIYVLVQSESCIGVERGLLLDQLCLRLPEQPPPRITAAQLALATQTPLAV